MFRFVPVFVSALSMPLFIHSLDSPHPFYLSIYISIYLSTYIPIYLSTYLPTYLPTYLHVSLSCVYRSVSVHGDDTVSTGVLSGRRQRNNVVLTDSCVEVPPTLPVRQAWYCRLKQLVASSFVEGKKPAQSSHGIVSLKSAKHTNN